MCKGAGSVLAFPDRLGVCVNGWGVRVGSFCWVIFTQQQLYCSGSRVITQAAETLRC